MGNKSAIEWTDATWNPVTGCTKVSEGCKFCYAERITDRRGEDFRKVVLHPDRLEIPLHWKQSRRVFVNSMSDLFHEEIPIEFLADVFAVMHEAWFHIFQVLTKRAEYMAKTLGSAGFWDLVRIAQQQRTDRRGGILMDTRNPLANVWLGVSVENQERADERIPWLLRTPAAVRFLSVEPLLGPVDLTPWVGRPSEVCQDCRCKTTLDFEIRQNRPKEGDNIIRPVELPNTHGLPAMPTNSSKIPVDVTTKGSLEPSYDTAMGIIDAEPSTVGPMVMPHPLNVPFSVEETSDVADESTVRRNPNRLRQEDSRAGSSHRHSSVGDRPPNGRLTDLKSRGDLSNSSPSNIGPHDLSPCLCRCHSLHSRHCTNKIGWCIVGGESGGPPERALVAKDEGRWWPITHKYKWVQNLRDQCVAAGMPFFFKQWGGPIPKSGGRLLDGRIWDEFPAI